MLIVLMSMVATAPLHAEDIALELQTGMSARAAAFSKDGSLLAVATDENSIVLWNARKSKRLKTVHVDGKADLVGFSASGRYIVISYNGLKLSGVVIFDLQTSATVAKVDKFGLHAALSPDGRLLTFNGDPEYAVLYDVESHRILKKLPYPTPVTGSPFPLKRVFQMMNKESYYPVFSSDSRYAYITNGSTRKFDVATGRLVSEIKGQYVYAISSAAESDGIVSLCLHDYLKDADDLVAFDFTTGRSTIKSLDLGRKIYSCALSSDARQAIFKSNQGFFRFDVPSRISSDLPPDTKFAFFDGRSDRVLVSTKSGSLSLRAPDLTPLERWPSQTMAAPGSVFIDTAPGSPVALLTSNGSAGMLDLASGRVDGAVSATHAYFAGRANSIILTRGDDVSFCSLSLQSCSPKFTRSSKINYRTSNDGALVAEQYEHNILIFDTATNKQIANIDIPGHWFMTLEFRSRDQLYVQIEPLERHQYIARVDIDRNTVEKIVEFPGFDGSAEVSNSVRFATVRYLEELYLLNVRSKRSFRLSTPSHRIPYQTSFSPDDKFVAVGFDDGSVTVYDVDRATPVRSWIAQNGAVYRVMFQSQDRLITSGDHSVRIWKVSSASLVGTCYYFGSAGWLFVTPEGFFNASENGASALNLIRGLKAYSLGQAYQSLFRPDLVRAKLAGDPDGKVKAAAARLDLSKVVDSGVEPQVKFASTDLDVSERTKDVMVSVTDGGGGIGKVEWRVNGVTQGIDEGGVAKGAAPDTEGHAGWTGTRIDLHRMLPLEPGTNKVEVLAYNAAGLIASDPVGITITRNIDQTPSHETAAATTPRLFVLAVAVNDYFDGRLRLAFAVPDAKALADGFQKAGAGLYSEVSVTTLLNQDVTLSRLDATFAELGAKVRPTDVFVFFIAGHGKTIDGHYHFIPYDFRYQNAQSILTDGIDQDHFQAWLARIPARKSLMLTDTCESGSLTEDPMRVASRGLETVEAQSAAIELLTRAVGRTVLSASTDDAPALEGYRGHGVFSYAVLDALTHAQAGSDGFITVTSLAGFVDQRVQDVSYKAFHIRQIPQMRVVGSNFPVAHRLAAALVSEDGQAEAVVANASDGAAISSKPTHVVIAPITVRATADAAGAAVTDLAPGTQVTLVQTDGGWTIVARDGKKLGYVKADALARMQ